ncbi:28S ribosomal protein S9, mitochondrial isoform X4 [Bombus terrestris]|uniref:Small ribosomal subunit protein uS9m n=1 Tax=Bombus terrestris TaxID=30195 RepID=A0A9C6SC66_BOMTE|nr:28S ribosomal protein S9, mitochondrial isoform X4 [Bombus terrestris]
MAVLMFTRFINLRNVININNFGAIGSILNITQCSDVISKPYCVNINDQIIPDESEKLTEKKISSAMRAYLKRSENYKEFMKKQIAEYDIGKRYLANIMGIDPENFTKEDVNSAIRYLFPSGLYDREARPMMLHPIDMYGNRKEAEFDETGRPHHFLFYTTKPNYYEILHNIAKSMIHLNETESQLLGRNIQLGPEHKIDLEYDNDNRPFVLIDKCARKDARGEVKVIGNGSGKITINGKDLTYFDDMQCREQIIFPLIFAEMIDKVDIEATISGGGPTGQAGAVRFGIAWGLQSFVNSEMREKMRLAGLLTYDWRRRERKKWGQEGARRKFTWKKR